VTPLGVNVADVSSDPSWNPPDEFSITTTETERASRPSTVAGTLPTPQRQEIARGQLHAAY
jgi:hypothetical protein